MQYKQSGGEGGFKLLPGDSWPAENRIRSRPLTHNFDIENRKRCGWPVDLKNSLFQKLVDIRDAGEGDFTAGERPAL